MDALKQFRSELNQIDEQLVKLLGKRFDICGQVALFKRENGIPMMQPARVAEVKERSAQFAASNGVDPGFARALFGTIIDEACRLEDEIIDTGHADRKAQRR